MAFEKGWAGGPGRQKLEPEVVALRSLTTNSYVAAVNKYLHMGIDELRACAKDPNTIVLEQMVISVVMHAIKFGDYKRIESLLARAIGPVQANIFLAQMQAPVQQPEGVTVDVSQMSDQALKELMHANPTKIK